MTSEAGSRRPVTAGSLTEQACGDLCGVRARECPIRSGVRRSGGGNLTGDTEDKVDGVLVGQCRVVEGLVPTREGGYPVWLRLADLLGVELDDRDVGLVAGHFE